jgi:hypothetical protein
MESGGLTSRFPPKKAGRMANAAGGFVGSGAGYT